MIVTEFKNCRIVLDNEDCTISIQVDSDNDLELNADEVVQFFQLLGAQHQVMNQISAAKIVANG